MREERTGQPNADRTGDQTDGGATERPTVHVRRRLTVSEAAGELGISAEAVRSRIKRGTLRSSKEGGTVYVLMHAPAGDQTQPGADRAAPGHDQTSDRTETEPDRADDRTALVEALEDQVSHLREQLDAERSANRENRRLLAAALERIPAIDPPRDERGSPETGAEGPEASPRPDTMGPSEGPQEPRGEAKQGFWRWLFGFRDE